MIGNNQSTLNLTPYFLEDGTPLTDMIEPSNKDGKQNSNSIESGSFSQIYLTKQKTQIGSKMVMKVVTLQSTDEAKKQAVIKNEKEVVALIFAELQKNKPNSLPNVVTPFTYGPLFNSSNRNSKQINGHYFMFEYLTGQLTKLKFNKVLSEENCANIIYQVANGLYQLVALNKNFVHRDISLNNIMYVENNNGLIQFKLIDFGTSILDANRNEQNSGITTALINAPEILKQGDKKKFSIVGNKEDVFSLGICLFMLLSQKDKKYGNHVVLSS